MQDGKKAPTIQDVARFAEVSSATVSRALSTPERVSEATLARITEAVAITGYSVNQAARSLRLRAARTVLIALPNIGNPFYSTILDAVVEVAANRGYGVLVANRLGSDPTMGLKDYFYTSRADGLLLFDSSLDLAALEGLPLAQGKLPLVVSCDDPPTGPFNVVTTDNRLASERAVTYLVELGHRRIGHVMSRHMGDIVNERRAGYETALARSGLTVRADWMWQGDHSIQGGIAAAEAFLALSERPTAVFCGNDETAIGFISRLRQAGVECPRDVSVIGYDDISVAEHFFPPLTTVRQPRHDLGRAAAELLIDLLEAPGAFTRPRREILLSELIVRASTAPPPAS